MGMQQATAAGVDATVSHLIAGSMVTTDIAAARRFYEDFLGFECVQPAAGRLLARDRYARAAMEAGDDDFFVLDVTLVSEISNPQRMLHHWGLDVASVEEVDRIYAAAKSRKDELGITKLMPISGMHGAHSFYFADRDSNWWEIEYRLDGLDNEGFFARGDVGSDRRAAWVEPASRTVLIDPDLPGRPGVLAGNARLTHGTCEQQDLGRSRRFVEDVLRLRCVRHLEPAQMLAGRGGFGIFAIGLPRVRPQEPQNRWIISVDGRSQVEAAAERARRTKAEMGLLNVGEIVEAGDEASITVEDMDGNWWQIVDRAPADYQRLFAAGDFADRPQETKLI
jgi:catechol 2,3-dioxygenase-like lactoylglutathione lyase family enzyme